MTDPETPAIPPALDLTEWIGQTWRRLLCRAFGHPTHTVYEYWCQNDEGDYDYAVVCCRCHRAVFPPQEPS